LLYKITNIFLYAVLLRLIAADFQSLLISLQLARFPTGARLTDGHGNHPRARQTWKCDRDALNDVVPAVSRIPTTREIRTAEWTSGVSPKILIA
jgi:hypothetical protein